MENRKNKTVNLAVTSVLAAIIILISFFPLKTMGLEINFSMVPVAIGAIFLGPSAGAILGLVFGAVSFAQCFFYSPFGAALLQENAFYTFLVCVPTRVLAGFLTGLIYKGLKSIKNNKFFNAITLPATSFIAPLLNTVFFMGTLVLLFYTGSTLSGFATALKAANPFMFIILFVGINGLVEMIASFVLTVPCVKVLDKIIK